MISKILKQRSGFMMLEMILYLSLFAMIIVGSVSTFYQLSNNNQRLDSEILIIDEAEFLLQKINWLLNSFEEIKEPLKNKNSNTLHLVKNNSNFFVYETDGVVYLKRDDEEQALSSERIKIEDLEFENVDLISSQKFFGIQASFEVDGREFKTIRFVYD